MRSVKRKHARRILLVAILASGFPVAAQGSSEFLGPTPVDSGMLAEVRALYGLDDRGAIERLAAENDAANVYRRIKGARLDGYAGAWFDAVSGKLQVALSVPEWADLISRLGATPVLVDWSLQELT
jgi:streptogrisin C